MKKSDLELYIVIIIILLTFYIGTCTIIQRFKCKKMTETELFFNVFNSIMLDFKECKIIK